MDTSDASETLMEDGEWLVRRFRGDHWVSHTGCFDLPRRVRNGVCYACRTPAPGMMMGFLNMVKWEM